MNMMVYVHVHIILLCLLCWLWIVPSEEDPFSDSSNGASNRIWSSNVAARDSSNLIFPVEDISNLVLLSNAGATIIWQEIDNLNDVFLPEISFSIDGTLTEKMNLCRGWKSPIDSSGANSTVGTETQNLPQVLLSDGDPPFYRDGPSSEYHFVTFSGSQEEDISFASKYSGWIVLVIGAVLILASGILWLTRKYGRSETALKSEQCDSEFGELPIFKHEKLMIATNNFHESNKIGRGGFGVVYKGKLEDGAEVAIKRLSKASGQGLTEFMTEVLVISKLQHRNIVRLLGCCVEGEEKLLVYEYMPNKSLDVLLFGDRLHQELLDWKTRYDIIQGICRGILYLHRDSRFKIIHRDLKASNILLDDKLIPKISDFGMARIFGSNQDQANATKAVGTYGYMSPEYVMEGHFSEKSDVFSFGVLLLEIVSGRRNSSFKDEECLGLLAYAWKIWSEDDIMSLIDPAILDSGFKDEIVKCMQVALLCVQELPEHRPDSSMVIYMIDTEASIVPRPTQPGFVQRRYAPQNQAMQDGGVNGSVSCVSLTDISGR